MKVAVVGAGFAGLRAAHLLERNGINVSVYEARGRLGGRVHTVDQGNGARYEAGGEWIDSDHHRVIGLLNEFGVEPVRANGGPSKLFWQGNQATEDVVWNDALEDDLRFDAAAKDACLDLQSPPWHNLHMAELDQETLASFVRSHTHSERGRWWLTAKLRSDEGDDLDQIGLLGWLSGYLHYLDREDDAMSAFRIPEGGEFFCQRLARSLRAPVELDRVLQRVIQSPTGVKLEFTDGMVEVDRVILTLPPPALERVIFEPALSVEKRCAVEACRMSRAVKICWEFSEPWWKDQGWGGRMLCDGPLQQTWDGGQGEAAILTAYVCGKEAVAWNTLGDPVRAGIYELSQLFPEAAKTFKRGWWHDWVTDPFARGAFSHLAPGYVLEHMGHIAPPQGRIHFAGEHTALWTGFIEGALESAERVVTEIIAIEAEP